MDQFLLFLHVASAIFLLGPLVVVMSATPRYIHTRDVAVLRFLRRSTFVYATGSLAVFVDDAVHRGDRAGVRAGLPRPAARHRQAGGERGPEGVRAPDRRRGRCGGADVPRNSVPDVLPPHLNFS